MLIILIGLNVYFKSNYESRSNQQLRSTINTTIELIAREAEEEEESLNHAKLFNSALAQINIHSIHDIIIESLPFIQSAMPPELNLLYLLFFL